MSNENETAIPNENQMIYLSARNEFQTESKRIWNEFQMKVVLNFKANSIHAIDDSGAALVNLL